MEGEGDWIAQIESIKPTEFGGKLVAKAPNQIEKLVSLLTQTHSHRQHTLTNTNESKRQSNALNMFSELRTPNESAQHKRTQAQTTKATNKKVGQDQIKIN